MANEPEGRTATLPTGEEVCIPAFSMATYRGPIKHLQGEKALVRKVDSATLLAQFNDVTLTRDGKPLVLQREVSDYEPHAAYPTTMLEDIPEPPRVALGYGWHEFPTEHFQLEEAPNDQHP